MSTCAKGWFASAAGFGAGGKGSAGGERVDWNDVPDHWRREAKPVLDALNDGTSDRDPDMADGMIDTAFDIAIGGSGGFDGGGGSFGGGGASGSW